MAGTALSVIRNDQLSFMTTFSDLLFSRDATWVGKMQSFSQWEEFALYKRLPSW